MRYIIADTIPYAPGKLSEYEIFLKYREEYPHTAISQMIFLHNHPKEFFDAVERRLMPKVLKDIMYILKKGWAKRISTDDFSKRGRIYDFNHCHILGEFSTTISGNEEHWKEDLDKIISSSSILYHTREYRDNPHIPEHNVLSSLSSEPRTLNPDEFTHNKNAGVNHLDLDKIHLAQLNFKADNNGQYKLEDGKRLDFLGILLVDPTRRTKV
jgi:hypothetical protein